MRLKLLVLLSILQVFLYACSTPADRPELAIYSTDLSATDVQLTRNAERTATAARIEFDAHSTALAIDNTTNAARSASGIIMTQQALSGTALALESTGISLNRLSGQATQTAQMWPAAAQGTSAAIYKAAELGQVEVQNNDRGWIVAFAVVGVILFAISIPTLSKVVAWSWTQLEEARHNREMNLYLEASEGIANEIKALGVKEPPEPDNTQADITGQLWRTRLALFFAAGDNRGFSNGSMCNDVISNRNWGRLTEHLCNLGVLQRDTRNKLTTTWGAGYDLARALAELRSGTLPLPIFEPCDVRWGGNGARVTDVVTLETVDNVPVGG